MAVQGSTGSARGRERRDHRLWAPVLANLLIGVVAVVPGLCIRWLATEHCNDAIGCEKDAYEPAPVMGYGAVLGGLFVLGMVLIVDVLMPRQEGWRLHRWLGMAVLVPVPFAVSQALGWV
ncbi:hypothetical protein ACFV6G_03860 [Streptomyces lavendulae]|uniref:hypothetical protein n=1 Tax=Streptomyces lavendulae TaxID=1914 RepID=UPI0036D0D473